MPKTKGEYIAEAVQKRFSTITDGERKAKAAADALEEFRAWICETYEEFFDLSDDLGTVAERLRRQAGALDARAAIHSKVPYGDGVNIDRIDALENELKAAGARETLEIDFELAAIKIKLDEIAEIRTAIARGAGAYYNENGDFDDDDDDDDKNTD